MSLSDCPGIGARLEQSSYSVSEETGFIEVCVVLEGIIERNVGMELTTDDGTATGIELLKTD